MTILRPETPQDRARQQALARRIARAFGLRARHMLRFDPVDALLISQDGEHTRGALDVKLRNCTSTTYPTCLVEVHKIHALQLMGLAFGASQAWLALFAVRWTDGVVGVIHAGAATEYPTKFVTLRDARDHGDVNDECYLVPLDAFTRLDVPCAARVWTDPDEDWSLTP